MSEVTVESNMLYLTISVDMEKVTDYWIDDLDAELAHAKMRITSEIEKFKEGRL
jgi:hypothetical protein